MTLPVPDGFRRTQPPLAGDDGRLRKGCKALPIGDGRGTHPRSKKRRMKAHFASILPTITAFMAPLAYQGRGPLRLDGHRSFLLMNGGHSPQSSVFCYGHAFLNGQGASRCATIVQTPQPAGLHLRPI